MPDTNCKGRDVRKLLCAGVQPPKQSKDQRKKRSARGGSWLGRAADLLLRRLPGASCTADPCTGSQKATAGSSTAIAAASPACRPKAIQTFAASDDRGSLYIQNIHQRISTTEYPQQKVPLTCPGMHGTCLVRLGFRRRVPEGSSYFANLLAVLLQSADLSACNHRT